VRSTDYGSTWEIIPEHEWAGGELFLGEDTMVKRLEIDQIGLVMEALKKDPFGRRHCISAWNVADLPKMALSPCHAFFQFDVSVMSVQERSKYARYMDPSYWERATSHIELDALKIPRLKLSCKLYQRSADLCLGVPFNDASYAALTMMMAQCLGYAPGNFIHSFGSAHIYNNHIEGAKLQLTREPYPLPRLLLSPSITKLEDFTINDLTVADYQHHDKIDFPVAV
jgi:thymidylate synthase